MSKALVKIQFVRRPISQQVIGYRLGADGVAQSFFATKEEAPSFRKLYLIAESSDYSSITFREIERLVANLAREGYTQPEQIGNWDVDPLVSARAPAGALKIRNQLPRRCRVVDCAITVRLPPTWLSPSAH